jgi:hypothetical protein
MTQAEEDDGLADVEALLVRQIKGLVSATADMMGESTGRDPLEIEARLYKMLAVDCEAAAQSAEAFAAEPDDPSGERDEDDRP